MEKRGLFQFKNLLRIKNVRSLSGVNVIAVMTHPFPCPKDKPCIYCPGGPSSVFGDVPQSYTGKEPAAMRAIQNEFNPYMQVKQRIKQLSSIGHTVSKVELIIMGGTFPAMSRNYQRGFVKKCLDALNNKIGRTLEETKRLAESSEIRNVGLTVETRPDYSKKEHINLMLELGVTRVELGVQTIYDEIYSLINREHGVKDVYEATQQLKDSGLKVCYHIMPGLPGSTPKMDVSMAKEIFMNEKFKPDMLKIYPTLVIPGTKLYTLWKEGVYIPYSLETAIEVIAAIKSLVPPWVRIMRVQRDIPAPEIAAGVKKSNLRQLIKEYMDEKGLRCKCIRCNEIGRLKKKKEGSCEISYEITSYEASGGREFFLTAKLEDALVGFLRLRFPSSKVFRWEIRGKSALVRELHVYGEMIPVGAKKKNAYQHKGVGKKLLSLAEEISEKHRKEKILVTSALGTKLYYKRLGYEHLGAYMVKYLP